MLNIIVTVKMGSVHCRINNNIMVEVLICPVKLTKIEVESPLKK